MNENTVFSPRSEIGDEVKMSDIEADIAYLLSIADTAGQPMYAPEAAAARLRAELAARAEHTPHLSADVEEAFEEAAEALNDAVNAAGQRGNCGQLGAAIRNHQRQLSIIRAERGWKDATIASLQALSEWTAEQHTDLATLKTALRLACIYADVADLPPDVANINQAIAYFLAQAKELTDGLTDEKRQFYAELFKAVEEYGRIFAQAKELTA